MLGIAACCKWEWPLIIRRVFAIVAAGASLTGCSSFSLSDYFKSTPPSLQVQLESQPSGADAKTSLGPGCKTPCSVSVPAPDNGFSVNYTLAKYQPATVEVQTVKKPGDLTTSASATTNPNPVFAELQPDKPKVMHPKRSSQAKAAATATPAPTQTVFPNPNTPPPPPASR